MASKIVLEVVMTIVGFTVTGLLGFFIAKFKDYKKRDEVQQEALKCLLRSNITSKYYVYTELGAITPYEKQNINYMHEQYKKMGGNSYVDEIIVEINKLPVKK